MFVHIKPELSSLGFSLATDKPRCTVLATAGALLSYYLACSVGALCIAQCWYFNFLSNVLPLDMMARGRLMTT